jgi:hypothetical protein
VRRGFTEDRADARALRLARLSPAGANRPDTTEPAVLSAVDR